MELPRTAKRPRARTGKIQVRYSEVQLQPPKRKPGLGSVTVWVVTAVEVGAPPGQEPVEWKLITQEAGDVFAKAVVRLLETFESIKIVKQAAKQIPEGPINSQKPQYQVRVPAGEAYGRIESPKGELAFYVVSNGKPNPWRYHVRPASFVNITCLEQMCIGTKIADFVALLGVLDIVMGELDR